MRPLDPLPSIKLKLGAVIVAAVAVTLGVVAVGLEAGLPLAVCGLAAGLLALGMVQVLARGMTSPLREMSEAASSMAGGNYDRRVTASSRDEVGDLARAFNAMAADLAEVDRMRRDLIANVSHELRTPLAALQAVLENLVDGVEQPDPATLQAMQGQVERLGRLVTQLLDLSRLEAGVEPLERRRFRLDGVLEEAVRESRLHAQDEVALSLRVEPVALEASGDPERVHQVVANLLENAVRHSPPGGRVDVGATSDGAGVRIEVADEGPGIPDDEAARVFERFYRADGHRTSAGGGSGLGLAIARWIVDLHGGDIRVERGQPSGCRMIVTLPG